MCMKLHRKRQNTQHKHTTSNNTTTTTTTTNNNNNNNNKTSFFITTTKIPHPSSHAHHCHNNSSNNRTANNNARLTLEREWPALTDARESTGASRKTLPSRFRKASGSRYDTSISLNGTYSTGHGGREMKLVKNIPRINMYKATANNFTDSHQGLRYIAIHPRHRKGLADTPKIGL